MRIRRLWTGTRGRTALSTDVRMTAVEGLWGGDMVVSLLFQGRAFSRACPKRVRRGSFWGAAILVYQECIRWG